jgi:hypothetical protein
MLSNKEVHGAKNGNDGVHADKHFTGDEAKVYLGQ